MNPTLHCSLVSFVCLLLNTFYTVAGAATHRGNETDQLALLAFKATITDDPFGALQSWNESNLHLCSQWYGVKCGRRHQRVTALDLGSMKLGGTISPYIGNLSFLQVLFLDNNSFTGEIPPELGQNLRRLKHLLLNNNTLGGEIPRNLTTCSKLLRLDLSCNKLVGKIPTEFVHSLSSTIHEVYMERNHLTGSIPNSFGNLTSLLALFLTDNNLIGSIPTTFGLLAALETIDLSNNKLSGRFPMSVFNLSHIKQFDISVNKIQGILPSYLGDNLPNLEFFSIGENQFTGSIPASLSNSSELLYLNVGSNKLTGKVPTAENLHKLTNFLLGENDFGGDEEANDLSFICSLTNATELIYMDIERNMLGGMLPTCFSNLSRMLSGLYFGENHIHGSIPTGILNFVNLADLYFPYTRLEGNLPTEMGRLQKLQRFSISHNQLSGTIPSSLGNLSLLNHLYLHGNHFDGNIPSSLGNCQNLVALTLFDNNLSGRIPTQIFSLSSLSQRLDLSQNYLSGSLPYEVGNLRNLEYLNVSDNMLSGKIPSTLGSCVRLEFLDIRGNTFQGSIPASWSSLRGIRFLDISRNNISGEIPNFLGSFALSYLNLSFNAFEGELLREGIFKNATAVSVNGNLKLCGGIPELNLPSCSSKVTKKKRSSANYKFVVPIVLGVISLLLCLLTFCLLKMKRRQNASETREHSLFRLSYQTLNKATNGFSSANLIGMGAFGTVYKGILDDGRHVAVKVLKLENHGAAKSFVAECDAWRNIRHRNLVKIVTACSSIDFHRNDFRALVYEFMVNGSLEEWLHPVCKEEEEEEALHHHRHLNLFERLNIAIDVAVGLDYLHNDCQPPIVHCDIKPSNVLLDDEMTAHIGDFGIARLIRERTNSVTSHQASSIGVKGSIGYTAPEYGTGSTVSTSGDVYSFGILLLEMITGKRPTDDMFRGDLNLHNFAQMALPDRVTDIVDKSLSSNEEDQMLPTTSRFDEQQRDAATKECLTSVIKIGLSCSLDSPQDRMKINDVVRELLLLRGNLWFLSHDSFNV